jgi:NAD(P)-dependent dehydrogenase (short-subunit alcohol dehydrogenase family)
MGKDTSVNYFRSSPKLSSPAALPCKQQRYDPMKLANVLSSVLLACSLLMLSVTATSSPVADALSPTILVTGSNRGIGLGLVKEFADRGWNVIATCRNPGDADELQALAASSPKIRVEKLDVTSQRQIDKLAARYQGTPIDVLFNNAAILGEPAKQQIGDLDRELFEQVMLANVYGPLKVSQAFTEHVAASKQKKIIGMTSGLGSLTLMGRMSRFYYYQMSKAALNMGMRAMRNDLRDRGIVVALLAPGMVDTGLLEESGYTGKSLSIEESAAGLYKLVAGLSPDDKGVPVNVDGKPIPW